MISLISYCASSIHSIFLIYTKLAKIVIYLQFSCHSNHCNHKLYNRHLVFSIWLCSFVKDWQTYQCDQKPAICMKYALNSVCQLFESKDRQTYEFDQEWQTCKFVWRPGQRTKWETKWHTKWEIEWHTSRQTDKPIEKLTDIPIERLADIPIERQTDTSID